MDRRTFLGMIASVPAAASIARWFAAVGRVFYVSNTPELLAAFEECHPGDHIYVKPGLYVAPVGRDLPAQQLRIVDTEWTH